jgi:hypothetical protein
VLGALVHPEPPAPLRRRASAVGRRPR